MVLSLILKMKGICLLHLDRIEMRVNNRKSILVVIKNKVYNSTLQYKFLIQIYHLSITLTQELQNKQTFQVHLSSKKIILKLKKQFLLFNNQLSNLKEAKFYNKNNKIRLMILKREYYQELIIHKHPKLKKIQ